MEKFETRIAHLERTVDDLSEVIARQDRELGQLQNRVRMLLEREADRESQEAGGVVVADERPPHY